MPHIIDADKLLEFVEEGMLYSRLSAKKEPVTQNGEYNQLKRVRDYIIENRI